MFIAAVDLTRARQAIFMKPLLTRSELYVARRDAIGSLITLFDDIFVTRLIISSRVY